MGQLKLFRLMMTCIGSLALISAAQAADHRYAVYAGLSQPGLDISIDNEGLDNPGGKTNRIIYQPRFPTIVVFGASIDWLSVSGSFDLPSDDGNSLDYTDYRLSLSRNWIGMDASYSEFLRFKIADAEGFAGDIAEQERFRPDLALVFMAANLYLFPIRWRFDFDKAFDPAARKQSGLGLGLLGSWNRLSLDTEFGLVPEAWRAAFGNDGQFERGELEGWNTQLALGAVLAMGDFYIAGLFAVGPGQHEFSYEAGEDQRSGEGHLNKLSERLSIGYSSKSLFMAGEYLAESPNYDLRFMSLGPSRSEITALAGLKW